MDISEDEQDILNEITNIGIGDAAAMLNDMVNCHIVLSAPQIIIVTREELKARLTEKMGKDLSVVEMKFSGEINGTANLLFPLESGKKLTNILSDDFDDEDYNSLKSGTLTEVGNIILNSVLASFSNSIGDCLSFSIPLFRDLKLEQYAEKNIPHTKLDKSIFLCEVSFSAEEVNIYGQVVLFFDVESVTKMFKILKDS